MISLLTAIVAFSPACPEETELYVVQSSDGVRGVFSREWMSSGTTVLEVASNESLNATSRSALSTLLFCHAAVGEASPWHILISSTLGKLGESLFESLLASVELRGAPHMKLEQLRWAQLRPFSQCRALFEDEPNEQKRAAILRAWSKSPHSRIGSNGGGSSGSSTFGLWLWAVHQGRSRGFTGHMRSGGDADGAADGTANNHDANTHVVLPFQGSPAPKAHTRPNQPAGQTYARLRTPLHSILLASPSHPGHALSRAQRACTLHRRAHQPWRPIGERRILAD